MSFLTLKKLSYPLILALALAGGADEALAKKKKKGGKEGAKGAAIGGAVGAAGGAAAGAATGAYVGAALGTALGPAGTAVGAGVGAAVGVATGATVGGIVKVVKDGKEALKGNKVKSESKGGDLTCPTMGYVLKHKVLSKKYYCKKTVKNAGSKKGYSCKDLYKSHTTYVTHATATDECRDKSKPHGIFTNKNKTGADKKYECKKLKDGSKVRQKVAGKDNCVYFMKPERKGGSSGGRHKSKSGGSQASGESTTSSDADLIPSDSELGSIADGDDDDDADSSGLSEDTTVDYSAD